MSKKFFIILLAIFLPLAVWFGLWLWILASAQPINNPLAGYPLWPVACSTRGCITTSAWSVQHQLGVQFAKATASDAPSPETSLTTAMRRHLVDHASVQQPMTLADARRYREDVLNVKNSGQLQNLLQVELEVYDENVILPYLRQEVLRGQMSVESTEELYGQLSAQRYMAVLPFHFGWNKEKGEVTR